MTTMIVYSQSPTISWQKTIGGADLEKFDVLIEDSDGNYILGGHSNSGLSGDKTENNIGLSDYWIVKTDHFGNVLWDNTIGGTGYELMTSIGLTSDGGYILGGTSDSDISGDKTEDSEGLSDYWVLKLDTNGNILWQNTIGGEGYDLLSSIEQTPDGGYIVGGYSTSNVSGDKTTNSIGVDDYWILKLGATGDIEWQKTIGGDNTDKLTSLLQTTDGGYILGGYSTSNVSGDKTENSNGSFDYWVLKLNESGIIQWQNTIGGDDDEFLWNMNLTADGAVILAGSSYSNISGDKTEDNIGLSDYWVVKVNALGDIEWENTLGGTGDDILQQAIQTADGNYFLGGGSASDISGDKTENSIGGRDYWALILNPNGELIWQNTIGGSLDDFLNTFILTSDGSILLGGASSSNISGDKTENSNGGQDYWIINLDGNLGIDDETLKQAITIYPNPTADFLTVASDELSLSEIKIYDTKGTLLKELSENNIKKPIDVSKFAAGIYYVQISSEEKTTTKMFVKQ